MKNTILILLFLPVKLLSQDITGVWTGTIYNDTTRKYIPYEIAITENKGKLSGFSHTIFSSDNKEETGVKSVKIKKKGDKILIEDDELVYNNYTSPPPKGVRQFSVLSVSENDSGMILSGLFSTNRTKEYLPLTGTIFLKKKKDFLQTRIIPKLKDLDLFTLLSFTETTQDDNITARSEISKGSLPVIQTKEISDVSIIKPVTGSEFAKPEKGITDEEKKSVRIPVAQTEFMYDVVKIRSAVENLPLSRGNTFSSSKKITSLRRPKVNGNLLAEALLTMKKEPAPKPVLKESAAISSAATNKSSEPVKQPRSEKKEVAVIPPPTKPATELVKENNIKTTDPQVIPKLKTPESVAPAIDLSSRKIETIRTVFFKSDSLLLSLYDNGVVDGDTVSVILNGKNIMPRQGLTTRAITKTIYITPELGDSLQLVMYAENLGSIPPNTGLLILQDGEDRYEIRFAGDLQKNSAIMLKRKKQP